MKTRSAGFTLVEIMVVQVLFGIVMIAVCSFYIASLNSWKMADLKQEVAHRTSTALERIVYGVGSGAGIRSAKALTLDHSGDGWALTIDGGLVSTVTYDPNAKTLTYMPGDILICENVVDSSALLEDNGVTVSVTVEGTDGKWSERNTMTTFASIRNAE